MKAHLLPTQVQAGHGAGSWHVNDGLGGGGGRLYYTAMSAMILEVYYRYLPIYGEQSRRRGIQTLIRRSCHERSFVF